MKDIVIIGSGGVGREASLIIQQINDFKPTWNVIGFLDDNPNNLGKVLNGYEVIGDVNSIKFIDENTYVIIAISNYKVKKNIVSKLNGRFRFATLIHPRVLIHDFMTVGYGTIIYEGAILTIDINIGEHVIISPKCGIGHDSIIRDYVSLLWNVNISGADIIEEGVLIGSGATVIQNLTVGRESIIGAGSVVVKNVPAYSTAVGIPAKIIRKGDIDEKDIICNNS
ncbi:MAG: acetyltransferase [Clostridium sp.]|uniref:acetyltransferase n=1 Tax=Clostridium sp. TaxID=1506 RepID=UPI003050DE0C